MSFGYIDELNSKFYDLIILINEIKMRYIYTDCDYILHLTCWTLREKYIDRSSMLCNSNSFI